MNSSKYLTGMEGSGPNGKESPRAFDALLHGALTRNRGAPIPDDSSCCEDCAKSGSR